VQELAFTLSDGFEYVRWCLDRGISIDDFAPRLSFFFNVTSDFFEEIAKFRAARLIWAREMRDTFHAKDAASWRLRTHAQTSGASLTAQDPENNVARVAIQALAAVLGGTQSLHTNAADEAWALPSEESALAALRTQQVIAHETGVADTVDPLGGSFYVETLTRQLAEGAYDYFRRIDEAGGTLRAIEDGFMQSEIADAAYRYQRDVDTNNRIVVGVNEYVSAKPSEVPLSRVDEEGRERHVRRLKDLRRSRDGRAVKNSLLALERVAMGSDNLMPAILTAVKSYSTLGEIMGVLRQVFGEYRPTWGP
jgi:methylmalonyl-CoA mutase N-terminal domain/subunit